MSEPLLSIIVPVYNIENYLKRCVDSITAQTYTNLEIILVDDGSTDNSLALCRELAGADSRIRVIHKENGGSSSARNEGLACASGEYIGFVDSDDYIAPAMYEKLYEAACRRRVRMVQCGRDDIDEQGNSLPQVCLPPKQEEIIGGEAFLRELLLHRGDASFCTKLVHRSLFRSLRFPEGELNEDFKLLVQLLDTMEAGVASIPYIGYHVFYKIGSNTRTGDKNKLSRVYIDIVNNADMAEKLVRAKHPGLKSIARRFGLFQRLEYMLHVPISDMNRDNPFYRNTVRYLRTNVISMLGNPYLTGKNKLYLLLLAAAPRGVRKLHRFIKTR